MLNYTFSPGEDDATGGAVGVLQLSDDGSVPTFDDLFDGLPQFYHGSTIQVQEILTIVTSIDKPSLVDVDLNWFVPRAYLGNFQILTPVGVPRGGTEDEGTISSVIHKIYRYSTYEIVANSLVEFAKYGQIALDGCNSNLFATTFTEPVTGLILPGFKYGELQPIWLGSGTVSRASLVSGVTFNQLIGGVGLYLNPGVTLNRVEYAAAIINTIATAFDPALVPACETIGDRTCQQEWDTFLQQNRIANLAFTSQAECEGIWLEIEGRNRICELNIYACSNDPEFTNNYFAPSNPPRYNDPPPE